MDKNTIERSFGDNRAPIEITEEIVAPQVLRYKIKPGWYPYISKKAKPKRVPVSTIKRTLPNIEADLEIEGLRVTQNGALWLEVPTDNRRVIKPSDVSCGTGELAIKLGIDVNNESLCIDLRKSPHLLIAGVTGSGKSVCVNAILTGLIEDKSPSELQLILIDPKFVEFASYANIAHLAIPIATDNMVAKIALEYATREMDKRYKAMAAQKVRDIKFLDMPCLVVVVDEYADIITPQIEKLVQRLAQMGRAAGIHLILATQRPSVDVVTGIIKANFPTRICFSVLSRTDSRVVLDSNGAEKLLGDGDGLLLQGAKLTRFQGVYLDDNEIDTIAASVSVKQVARTACGSSNNLILTLLKTPFVLLVVFFGALIGKDMTAWGEKQFN